jgi:putative endonuclease
MNPTCGFVYILASESGTLYTGVTSDLRARIWQHWHHIKSGFAWRYGCKKLVYFEPLENIVLAIAREKQIKGWRRLRKETLIHSQNSRWEDQAADWYYEEAPASKSKGSFALTRSG